MAPKVREPPAVPALGGPGQLVPSKLHACTLTRTRGLCRNSLSASRQATARPPARLSLPSVPGRVSANPSAGQRRLGCQVKAEAVVGLRVATWGDLGRGAGDGTQCPLRAASCPNACGRSQSKFQLFCPFKTRGPDTWAHQNWLLPSPLGCRVSFAHLGKPSWALGRSPSQAGAGTPVHEVCLARLEPGQPSGAGKVPTSPAPLTARPPSTPRGSGESQRQPV